MSNMYEIRMSVTLALAISFYFSHSLKSPLSNLSTRLDGR